MTSDSSSAVVNEGGAPKLEQPMAHLVSDRNLETMSFRYRPRGPIKYGPFLKMRFLSSIVKDEDKEAPTNKMAYDTFLTRGL
jgi:hypothetical protein